MPSTVVILPRVGVQIVGSLLGSPRQATADPRPDLMSDRWLEFDMRRVGDVRRCGCAGGGVPRRVGGVLTTQRSYGMDVLRWLRFLWALGGLG